MNPALPDKPDEFLDWDWSKIEPIFEELQQRTIDETNILVWLEDWSDISKLLDEIYWRLYDATAVDTSNQTAEKQFTHFLDEIRPKARSAEQSLKEKLLASGISPEGYQIPLRDMHTQAELFRDKNLSLLSEERKLVLEYDRIMGAQTVLWDGDLVPLPQLQPVFQEKDARRREKAWRLAAARQLEDRQALNELWIKFLELRKSIAFNADLPNYRAYRWQMLLRFDYLPEDCYQFHQGIEEVVVPAAQVIYQKRRQRLGVNTLRPWDLNVDPYGLPALKPFRTIKELIDKSEKIFSRVNPQFGKYFRQMDQEGLLDLENRANKAPGGFCSHYEYSQRPFIFTNAVGIHDDVQTILHEGGHAFHVFECTHRPYFFLEIPAEFAEVASMSMELLSGPYLEINQGGFYEPVESARARIQYLEDMLLFWPYMAVVDAFQHWVYENMDTALEVDNCDGCWAQLWARFMPGVDWSDLDQEMRTGWQRKPHIFDEPFYYIEYGLAQLGAVQIWRNALQDQDGAVAAYRKALSLGTSVTLPQLYETAGARFTFEKEVLREAVNTIQETISGLEEMIP
ncbi:MAG: M3 family oligoendopeptidase [Anaerolineales bacterium]